MHERNIYRADTDFLRLGHTYPALREYLIPVGSRMTIDFKNEAAQRCLTKALLLRDFGLEVLLPEDRLCPPVPNRLNYLLWVQDILAAQPGPSKPIRGIDIGTGASAIYPLLGCRLDPEWTFVATELDGRSLEYAQRNVLANDLGDRIRLVKAEAEREILPFAGGGKQENFDFVMCNPPFYGSMEEVAQSAEGKVFEPCGVCTGAPVEMITRGGEAEFVSRIVKESALNQTRCRWYTSMLGKMSSLTHVVGVLRDLNITNYAITEFIQGHTRRWAIGWSFTTERLPDAISRIANPALRSLMPLHNTIRQPITLKSAVTNTVPESTLKNILVSVSNAEVTSGDGYFLVTAKEDTWSRSARRKRNRTDRMDIDTETNPKTTVALACRLSVEDKQIVFQWMLGEDRGLFEGFCGHVSRKFLAS